MLCETKGLISADKHAKQSIFDEVMMTLHIEYTNDLSKRAVEVPKGDETARTIVGEKLKQTVVLRYRRMCSAFSECGRVS